ncbi:protein FAM205C isoform X5 [Bubalus bubalis]|uniref:protein FAM205C isoform X5 n=1 Tax=Bubalus bubalis TaxID=89462 RepID=UPI001E1B8889|nr:protein FAM205C isoform X5 [Bubalus bubalis]
MRRRGMAGGAAASPEFLSPTRRAVGPGASVRPPPAPDSAAPGLRQPGRPRQGLGRRRMAEREPDTWSLEPWPGLASSGRECAAPPVCRPLLPNLQFCGSGDSAVDIGLSFDQSQESLPFKQLSLPSATRTVSQLTNQKSVTQSAAKSATKPATKSVSAISIRQYWAGHQQLRQECRGPELPLDSGALSSSSLEEPRIPVNQHVKKKSNSEGILKKQEAVEVDLRNKLKHFTQWINPDTKGQGHKECILSCKDEKVAKTKTKKAEKSPPSTKRPMKGAKLEKEEGFFDALQCLDSEFQRQSMESVQSGQSCFLPLSSGSSKRSPLLTRATQPENPSHVSLSTSAEGTCLPQESTQSRKKELRGSQTSASS